MRAGQPIWVERPSFWLRWWSGAEGRRRRRYARSNLADRLDAYLDLVSGLESNRPTLSRASREGSQTPDRWNVG
jgi:hypothetical protein